MCAVTIKDDHCRFKKMWWIYAEYRIASNKHVIGSYMADLSGNPDCFLVELVSADSYIEVEISALKISL